MKILYIISKYITFPGAFLRCFWEQFVCKIQKVAIENNKCLQVNEMCGHIEHETIDGKVKSFLNALIPGLLVFIAGAVLLTAPFVNLLLIGILQKPLKVIMYVMLYLALSMLTNIFPSTEDAIFMWENYKQLGKGLKILFAPGAAIMYVGSYLEKYCVTFFVNIIIAALIIFL